MFACLVFGVCPCLEVWVISGKSLSFCACRLIHVLYPFSSLLSVFQTSVIHSGQLIWCFPWKEGSSCPEKSFTCFIFSSLNRRPDPCTFPQQSRLVKVMRMLVSFVHSLTTHSCHGRPLRQSSKLDFNEAIVFIKSNQHEVHSQESEQPTDGWVYQHIGVPRGAPK